MKTARDIEAVTGAVCRVWKSRPADSRHEHTRELVKTRTPHGEVMVCTKCHQEIVDIVAFENRRQVGEMVSEMETTMVQFRSKKEVRERLETRSRIYKVRKREAAAQATLFDLRNEPETGLESSKTPPQS